MLLFKGVACRHVRKHMTPQLCAQKHSFLMHCSMAKHESTIPERAQAVLSYWFGPHYDQLAAPGSWVSEELSKQWFNGGEEVDQYIKSHFTNDVIVMKSGVYDDWLTASPFSAVAGIILADQFTRNVYRGSAEAFSLDPKALAWAAQLVESGRMQQLPSVMRQFVVLPFMHSESLQDQQRCVDLATAEYATCKNQEQESAAAQAWAGLVQFAKAHRNVIEKWGRFPHRNAILGRQNTLEEEQGLADGSISRW